MSTTTTQQASAPSEPPPQPAAKRRVLPVVFGSLAVLVAVVLLAGGGLGVWALTQRADDGYFTTHMPSLSSRAFAFTTSSPALGDAPGWFVNGVGTVRIQ